MDKKDILFNKWLKIGLKFAIKSKFVEKVVIFLDDFDLG